MATAATALADQQKASLDTFAATNAACREWTDGCIICRRADARGLACSTPGIACQPKAVTCQAK